MHDFEKRSSNIELLRIVAMLIILVHHFCVHGILKVLDVSPFSLTVDNLTWQLVFVQLVGWGGNMCNGVFIVITGYFMLGKPVKYRKIIPLAVAMFFMLGLLH